MSRGKRKRNSQRRRLTLWTVLTLSGGWIYLREAKADGKAVSPLQKQIATQFEKMAAAMKAKNSTALAQFLTPDFTQKNLDGKTADRKAARKNFASAMKAMKTLSAGFTIDKTTPVKSETEVIGSYLFAGMTQPMTTGGKSQQLAMSLPIKTLWVKTKAGWLLKRMEQLKGGIVRLDGKVPGDG